MSEKPKLPSQEFSKEAREEMREMLEEVGKLYMPFGKYGPKAFPPRGVPIWDLPIDYLQWFNSKGFPTGKLGKYMNVVYRAKVDGADIIFEGLRKKAGGRHPLRVARKKEFNLDND